MMPNMITQKRLHDVLNYNTETGVFTWRIKISSRISIGSVAGTIDDHGYVMIKIDCTRYSAHRLAWFYIHGYFPEHEIDHIDRVKHHNWLSNLREAMHQCNSRNVGVKKSNKSGVVGVSWSSGYGKWVCYIKVDGKNINLGRSSEFSDAVQARWDAEVKYGFPNCNTTSSAFMWLESNDLIDNYTLNQEAS